MNSGNSPPKERMSNAEFIRKTLILMGLIVLALILWQLSSIVLLAFGSILAAIILNAAADALSRYLRVPSRWALAVASLLIFALFVGLLFLFGANMRTQMSSVAEQLPLAIDQLGRKIGISSISDNLSQFMSEIPSTGLVQRIAGIGGTVLGGLTDFALAVFAGLYIAASPQLYFDGFVKLFPLNHHQRIESALATCGQALRLWLTAQLLSMACVGVMAGLAFWLIGLPSPHALGLIAALLEFVPFLGPILGAVPAVLISITLGSKAMLWTVAAVVIVQQLEGNLIQPLLQRKMVNIPPALALFGIVIGGVLFGTLGLMLGFPLLVVIFVLVKKLYVREVLGETTPVPGEAKPGTEGMPGPAKS
ncbi:AI-2E family transporter [Microvirga puerhi]|uniref:AI-2E family transporter n=1 Tax=Microvirga puerhi TaxID=2876078 RepID=A0ABS7VLF8_9HYPH|nr:AI-2E family transporter [Microvirga puerhi]MBZ6076382.1 AI-2E family transporter [Microvirga puerhi]